jgi:hypothetical protein
MAKKKVKPVEEKGEMPTVEAVSIIQKTLMPYCIVVGVKEDQTISTFVGSEGEGIDWDSARGVTLKHLFYMIYDAVSIMTGANWTKVESKKEKPVE